MAKSRARLDDLQWLAEQLEQASKQGVAMAGNPDEQADRLQRLQDWMSVVIDTRLAQITQPQTKHHEEIMRAFEAAKHTWWAERERVTGMWPGDLAEYDKQHPAPTLKSFLTDQARRVEQARACDCPMVVDHRIDCPHFSVLRWTSVGDR